ncbi:MAG: hypothetical protein CMH55_04635 [Myxococcales bacterium]|nr:hypothetical protein [Myxococcales bacterium]
MSERSAATLYEALLADDSHPIDPVAKKYWLQDLQNPLRLSLLPLMRIGCTLTLHTVYFLKRLIPIQFRAHRFLQWLICFFMKYFVRPEANILIIRHFAVESNILNLLIRNSKGGENVPLVDLYPSMIRDLMDATFVDHDQGVLMTFRDLGSCRDEAWPMAEASLDWSGWRDFEVQYDTFHKKWTQFLDFETAHELFKTTFCLLLTAREYEAAINSFQFDESMALRIGRMIDEPNLVEMTANKFPLVLVSTRNLSRRFVLHGIFTEHLHAHLQEIRVRHHGR